MHLLGNTILLNIPTLTSVLNDVLTNKVSFWSIDYLDGN